MPNGRVLANYGFDGGGKTLMEGRGPSWATTCATEARILLMLLLQNGVEAQKNLQAAFSR